MTPSLPPEADDPSRRHVLAPGAPLLKNLAALWAADPALAAELEALHPTPSYPVETTKAGLPTIALAPQIIEHSPPSPGTPGEGRGEGSSSEEEKDALTLALSRSTGRGDKGKGATRPIYLHSRYQPVEEAARLVEPLDVDNVFAFYVHGLGLGYHVEQLFARSSGEALLFVFEPDLRLIRTALEHRDLSKLIESRRVTFITKPDKSDLFTRLTPHAALLSVGVGTLVHPPSLQVAGEFHRQVQAWLAEFESFTRTSINTLVLNSRRTAENVSRNIGWYVATPSLSRLANRHKGQPAIVVSAGPSLRKNIDLLRDAQDKAVIVAVQTTLKPLLEKGVSPHFVTSLDYHDICTRFFEKLPRTLTTELVAEPKAASAIFDLSPGPLSLLGNDFADSLLREMKPDKLRLPSGATVAHLAYYLAEHLGCDPIVFVGQDLGFSDGLCYAPGTSYDDVWRPELNRFCTVEMKQWEQIARERFILRRIPDHEGRPMYTEERLFSYLQQFERDFARSKAKIIDATEGGARKRGATRMKLADVIEQYCTRPIGRTGDDYPGLRWDRVAGAIDCLRSRREEAARIEQLSNETLPLLEEIRDHVEDQPRVNQAISRIDALRARMNELGATYDLVTQLTQGTEMRRFKADRSLSASKQLDGPERQRRQVTRDVDNVRAVAEAAREFRCLMDEVIDRLVAQASRAAQPPVHPNFRQEAA